LIEEIMKCRWKERKSKEEETKEKALERLKILKERNVERSEQGRKQRKEGTKNTR
jgi:hypothetical protein